YSSPRHMPQPGQLRIALDLPRADPGIAADRQGHEAGDPWHARACLSYHGRRGVAVEFLMAPAKGAEVHALLDREVVGHGYVAPFLRLIRLVERKVMATFRCAPSYTTRSTRRSTRSAVSSSVGSCGALACPAENRRSCRSTSASWSRTKRSMEPAGIDL